MSEETVIIYVHFDKFVADTFQYKPYFPEFSTGGGCEDIYVALEIPSEFVREESDRRLPVTMPRNGIVITPDGAAEMMGVMAKAIRTRLQSS